MIEVFRFGGDTFPPAGTQWRLLHPRMTMDHLGYVPSFIQATDQRRARDQINERYVFGGWQSFGASKWKLGEDNSLRYPGDPIMWPLATTMLRDELICFYRSSFVAIIQPDRSFEVARLD